LPTTKEVCCGGSNPIANGCTTTLKEVTLAVRAMLRKSKPNKTQWSEHPSIFNQLILFNSRIKFILKNKFNNKQQIKRPKITQSNEKIKGKIKDVESI
jgi:hypothetical protein